MDLTCYIRDDIWSDVQFKFADGTNMCLFMFNFRGMKQPQTTVSSPGFTQIWEQGDIVARNLS